MEKNYKDFGGVVVPMVTPLTNDYAIDEVAIRKIIVSFKDNKVQPLVLGTTGEVASLSYEQKLKVVEIAADEINGEIPLAVGLSGNCIDTLISEGEQYAALGADALVALAPNYYPIDDKHAYSWFKTLADKLPLPMFLYNIPATTHHAISLDVIEKLSHHSNIIGIKDSQADRDRLEESLKRWSNRKDFLFLVGCAANSSFGLKHGADGIVPSVGNLFPELYFGLFDAAKKGNIEEADRFQEVTNTVSAYNQKGRTVTEAIPALKALMSIKKICGTQVMPPMLKMSANEEKAYCEEMTDKILNFQVKDLV